MSNVNHPKHYNSGKFEVIDVIEDWKLGFNLGNTVKYVSRADHKNNKLEDLKKAKWYLDREIKKEEERYTVQIPDGLKLDLDNFEIKTNDDGEIPTITNFEEEKPNELYNWKTVTNSTGIF